MAKAAPAKPMSKSDVAAHLAEKVGITKKQATLFLQVQADLAYKQAKNSFVLPGLGKVVLTERGPRKMISRFGANAGKEVTIPKKRVLKFRFAKVAKDAIIGVKK